MKLYCRTYSPGNLDQTKPPIIFLHGMAMSGMEYKKVAPIIAKQTKRKVLVPDIRNHGNSPWVEEMNFDVLTSDLLELMQQNNIQRAILIGSSMGGRVAMNFALKYPQKVDALIIEDMTPRNIVSAGRNLVQFLYKIVQDFLSSLPPDTDLNEVKKDLAETIITFNPSFVDKEKVMANYDPDFVPLVKNGDKIRLECNADIVKGMLENDALVQNLPDLETTYDGDVLFLYGSKGFFKIDKDPTIKKLFPKAIIRRIENASHLIHIDSPEEYTDVITNFILHGNVPQSKL